MLDLLRTAEAQAVVLITVLLILAVAGWYIVSRYRDEIKGEESASDLLTKFDEMHRRGDLSQAEYRTIKAMLADKLQDELSDPNETG